MRNNFLNLKMLKRAREGFTLAELLVALGVFAFVVALASAIFIRAIKNERRLIIVMNMTSDLSSALEQMAREIRTGFLFEGYMGGRNNISFKNAEGEDVNYSLSGSQILRNGSPITSPNINVNYLDFVVFKEQLCDPWRITIVLGVSPKQTDLSIKPFYIQTTVSSRIWPKDIPVEYKNAYKSSGGVDYFHCQ